VASDGTARRLGRAAAAAVCAALLWAVNVSPGWQSWSVLTEEFARVVGVLNVSLAIGLVTNVVLLVRATPLLAGLGDAVTATLSLVVLAKLFVVLPFDVDAEGFDWGLAIRVLLGVAMIGAFVGVVAGLGEVARVLHVRGHLRERG